MASVDMSSSSPKTTNLQMGVPTTGTGNAAIAGKGSKWSTTHGKLARCAAVAGAALIIGAAATMVFPLKMALALGMLMFCIGMWASAIVPEYLPAFVFFLVASMTQVAKPEAIFSGFQSSTFWLLFSGAIMGAAISYTGLGRRAASVLVHMLGRRYWQNIAGIVVFSIGLAFIMPSGMGRAVLLVPITAAVAEHMGYKGNDNGRLGMLMAAAFTSFLPTFSILPSNAPNMVLSGMAETLYGIHMSYGSYLLLHFPVLGAIKSVLLVMLIVWLLPAPDPVISSASMGDAAPVTKAEKRLIAILGVCLLLWMTDSLHHIAPAWVGLAAAIFCLWPDSGMTSPKCISQEINYGPLFFVAGVMGLGAVISATGLGEATVKALSHYANFSPDRPIHDVVVLTLISTAVALVTNLAGVPATLTPLAHDMSLLTGLPIMTVLMTQVLAFSNVLLPFQAPPLIFAMQTANLPVKLVTRLCMILFVISLVLLAPLDFLWWHVLGWL